MQTAICAGTCRTGTSGFFNFITVGDGHVTRNQASWPFHEFEGTLREEIRKKIDLKLSTNISTALSGAELCPIVL